jgi:uncharacterized phage-associated protein
VANVFDVADFFIEVSLGREENDMTNLKLNKLLYYAQGIFLARTGRSLFEDGIEAWELGPVIPAVYHQYKDYGREPITHLLLGNDNLTEEEEDTLLDVARDLGVCTSSQLVAKTHAPGTPWSETPKGGLISTEMIRDYFQAHETVRCFSDILAKIPVAEKFPKEWYDPAEDAEWAAYLK